MNSSLNSTWFSKIDLSTLLLLIYVWWLISTPQYRFDILGIIHFERILALAVIVVVFMSGPTGARRSTLNWFFPLFLVCMFLSFLISPYQEFRYSQQWLEDYWKIALLYPIIIYGIRTKRQLFYWIAGIAIISFLYQIHSWTDFLQGGSYVWQQGLKRMRGVWSPPAVGSANAFGSLGVYTLPFAFFLWSSVETSKSRALATSVIAISILSILFSGTRAAVAVMVLYFVVRFRKSIFRPLRLLGLAILFVFAISILPAEYTERYLSIVGIERDAAATTRAEELAAESAAASADARIAGLVDGWNLLKKRPLLGYGPGSSAEARFEVNNTLASRGGAQLHNLYGQVMADTGILGTLLFASILLSVWHSTKQHASEGAENRERDTCFRFLRESLVVMFAYGMFSHTLYSYDWMILFATTTVATNLFAEHTMSKSTNGTRLDASSSGTSVVIP